MNTLVIDFTKYLSEEDFHTDIKKQLKLENWYGENLDAFSDSIEELPKACWRVCVIRGGDLPQAFKDVVEEIVNRWNLS